MRLIARRGNTVVIGEMITAEPWVLGEPYLRLYGDWDVAVIYPPTTDEEATTREAVQNLLNTRNGDSWDRMLAWQVHDVIMATLERPQPQPRPTIPQRIKELFR